MSAAPFMKPSTAIVSVLGVCLVAAMLVGSGDEETPPIVAGAESLLKAKGDTPSRSDPSGAQERARLREARATAISARAETSGFARSSDFLRDDELRHEPLGSIPTGSAPVPVRAGGTGHRIDPEQEAKDAERRSAVDQDAVERGSLKIGRSDPATAADDGGW